MKPSSRFVSGLLLISCALTAQVRERDLVPLRQWAAAPYWQPTNAEREAMKAQPNAAATLSPQAQLSALVFVAITPCRVVDTRSGQGFTGAFGPPNLAGGASRTFPIPSSTTCSIPPSASAYSFNITVVRPGPLGFITAYPTGQPLPLAATVNSPLGFIVGNAAVVPAGTSGSIDIFASNPTDIVIDINGYYVGEGTGPGGTYKVNSFRNLLVGETVTLTAMCNNGDVVIGGYSQTFGTTGFSGDQRFAQIAPIGPTPAPQGWTATATGSTVAPDFLNVFAVCLRTP